ncbi:hypothetical protein [Mesorhizobium sp. M0488]|uniref:hypothetical protein n=1 Tax=unclassified Mesorhizobium TaxID=325217 RepID=UPI00333A6996
MQGSRQGVGANSEQDGEDTLKWIECLTGSSSGEAALKQILRAWTKEGEQEQDEERQEAMARIEAWLETGNFRAELNLTSLSLTALPPRLPANLQWLNANDNRLTRLPNNLPPGLRKLDAGSNQLIRLPEFLPGMLDVLHVNSNRLTELPARQGSETLASSRTKSRSCRKISRPS